MVSHDREIARYENGKVTKPTNHQGCRTAHLPRTYKIVEVARILGIGRNQAYQEAGRLFPAFRVGKSLRAPKAPVDRLAATGSIAEDQSALTDHNTANTS